MRKKFLVLLLVFLMILTLTLSGCGGDSETDGKEGESGER